MLKTISNPRRERIHVGPLEAGKQMSLDQFDMAIAEEEYFYELNKGLIEVSGSPLPNHAKQIEVIRDQVTFYRRETP